MWNVITWLCFLAIVAFLFFSIVDVTAGLQRVFGKREPSSVDINVGLLYHDDPNAPPPVIDYASTRNARQRR